MRFKLGLAIGFVAGFVVGARAGKERYDKLVARIRATLASDRMHQATDLAERATRRPRASAGSGLVSVASTIRERVERDTTARYGTQG
jgi:hypothetical protein